MSGSLNIKNDRAVNALHRLASYYGTNCTQAIVRAAEEILTAPDETQLSRDADRIEAALDAYRALATNIGGNDDGMYDDDGLPLW